MLRTTVIVCGILLGLLVAAILIASSHGNILAGLRHLIADPWGVVTLLDLGVGLLFVAVWLALVEPNPRRAGADPIAAGQLPNYLRRTCSQSLATRSDLSATTLSLPGPHLITSR